MVTRGVGILLLALALAWGGYRVYQEVLVPQQEPRASLSPVDVLVGEATDGFERALEPRSFEFPADHGPHPSYRTEWWYVTGHLDDEEGRGFAFQVTFFRNALTPTAGEGESEWRTNQIYMAHFAVTDVEGERHRAFERLARAAVGLAGAEVRPFRVWVDGWRMEGRGEEELFPFRVQAAEEDVEVDLEIFAGKPPVLQGDRGLSPKGEEPGNASYYYSYTRLPVQGRVRIGGEAVEVAGEAWMDREWSTSALEPFHLGWDWFSLQLDDERELMVFELRRDDGRPDPFDYGVVVERDGSYRTLSGSDVELSVTGTWASPVDGTVYPSRWRLQIPDEGFDLDVRPRVADQEMDLSFRYWEGAVEASGTGPDGPVTGRGFAELTGYADTPGARSP